jgi:iron complex outermembrane receptor protein
MRWRAYFPCLLSFAAAVASPVQGQSSGVLPSAVAAPKEGALEEIVVTAEKRETNAQTTAVAITAISGEQLRARQITDVQALAQAVPNMQFGDISGQARIAIRGIGFDSLSFGSEARVAYHLDGVYISRPAAVLGTFFDVERIEVVRGPQGTLYGRNATGGAVNVITTDPSDTMTGYVNMDAGNFAGVKTEAALGGPISKDLSARIAVETVNHSGYGTNFANGDGVDNQNTKAARAKLKYEPTEIFDVLLTGDYMHESDAAYATHYVGQFNPAVPLAGVRLGGSVPPADPRDLDTDVQPTNVRTFSGGSVDAHLKLGSVDVRSITGYRHSELQTAFDFDFTTVPLSDYENYERSNQTSEELRFTGEFAKGHWLVGGYYFDESLFAATIAGLSSALLNPAAPDLPLREGLYAAGFLDTKGYAGFGEAQYDFTDRFSLTAGGRYSWEKKDINEATKTDFKDPFTGSLDFPTGATGQMASHTASAFTPKASLEFKPVDRVFLYATFARGFKSGGFNVGNVQPAFGPEKLTDYELGAKADWFDGRLRTNLATFFYDYTDLQVTTVKLIGVVPTAFTENAAKARIKGVEYDMVAVPIKNLRLEQSFTYLDSEYLDYASIDASRPALGVLNLSGKELTQAPKFSVNLAAEYAIDSAIGTFSVRGEGSWTDRVFFSPYNLDVNSRPAHYMFNAFITYKDLTEKWTAKLYVKNIADTRVLSSEYIGGAIIGSPLIGTFEPPRLFGILAGYHF